MLIGQQPAGRSRKRYSVYRKATDMPLVVYATAKECAAAMGMSLNSFYRALAREREGKIHPRRWEIYEDEVEETHED